MFNFKYYDYATSFIKKHPVIDLIYTLGVRKVIQNGTYEVYSLCCCGEIFLISLGQFFLSIILAVCAENFEYGYLTLAIIMGIFVIFNLVLAIWTFKLKCRSLLVFLIHGIITFWCLFVFTIAYEVHINIQNFKNMCIESIMKITMM